MLGFRLRFGDGKQSAPFPSLIAIYSKSNLIGNRTIELSICSVLRIAEF